MTIIGDRLREALADNRMKQADLARKIGVTQGAISAILLGQTRHSKHLPDIAVELGVSYEWLIGSSDEKFGYTLSDEPVFPNERHLLSRRRDLPTLDRIALDRVAEAIFAAHDLTRDVSRYLPDERALAAMFEGMLDQLPKDIDQAERARLLARWLPTSLSQLRDLTPVTPKDDVGKTTTIEAETTHNRESLS